jgi:hypothetical protein
MKGRLQMVLKDIENPATKCDEVWNLDDREALSAFIKASDYHAKETIAGGIR